jgi:hypothetical protein
MRYANFSYYVVSVHHFWANNLSDHNCLFVLLPLSSLCFVSMFASRRALATGQTHLTKNALVETQEQQCCLMRCTHLQQHQELSQVPTTFSTLHILLSTHFL